MKKLLLCLILIIGFVKLSAQNRVTVIEDSLFSTATNSYMRFNVVLPANYYTSDERYTTIYLLHGYGGGENDWITRTGLVGYLKEYNFIVVTPDGKNSWYSNSPTVKNKNFEDHIMKEIIPTVEKKYRALSTRHGRVIAGLSMGGVGALKFGMKFPSSFFIAASFSGALQFPHILEEYFKNNVSKGFEPTLKDAFGAVKSDTWTKNDPFVLLDSTNVKSLPYLYIAVGKDDPLMGIVDLNRSFSEKLRKKNAIYEYHELPGVHNWVFWDKEIKALLFKISEYDSKREF